MGKPTQTEIGSSSIPLAEEKEKRLDGLDWLTEINQPHAVDMELDGWPFHLFTNVAQKRVENTTHVKCAYRSNRAGSRLDPTRRKTYMWLVLDCDTFRASLWNTNIVVFPRRKTLKSLVSLLLLWYNNNIRRTHYRVSLYHDSCVIRSRNCKRVNASNWSDGILYITHLFLHLTTR